MYTLYIVGIEKIKFHNTSPYFQKEECSIFKYRHIIMYTLYIVTLEKTCILSEDICIIEKTNIVFLNMDMFLCMYGI